MVRPARLRCAGESGADALAARLGGTATPLADALACDIVCVHVPITLRAAQLRRGTHVNLLSPLVAIDADLGAIATVVNEVPGLGALAAGLVDGRQLDELTLFWLGDATIAAAALAALGDLGA